MYSACIYGALHVRTYYKCCYYIMHRTHDQLTFDKHKSLQAEVPYLTTGKLNLHVHDDLCPLSVCQVVLYTALLREITGVWLVGVARAIRAHSIMTRRLFVHKVQSWII